MYYKINTFGCQMNVHESEKVAGLLENMGYTETNDDEIADVICFNTCCVRDTAERRALGNIGMLKSLKKRRRNLIIVVFGCMVQQPGEIDIIKQKYPYIDICLGTRNINLLQEEIEKVLNRRATKRKNDKNYRCFDVEMPEDYLDIDENIPQTRTSFPNAWINIIYGCNNFCTYCIVPYVRGREVSRSMEDILNEVKSCLNAGYKEITLLGQNVNSYGNDIDDPNVNFPNLLREIDKLPGKFRLRFMTSHPKDLSDDLIAVMKDSTHICKNLHLPVQAGSTKVLGEMNRRYSREKYLNTVKKLREAMPDIGLTTDIMVGFPTETEEDFQETLSLVEEVRYSSAFTFIYSPRRGTPASEMPQIKYAEKSERIGRLIKLQNKITKEISNTYLNNTYEVLCEDVTEKHEGMVCGRTDCGRLVTFPGSKEDIGKFINVKITEAHSASLFGVRE